MSEQRTPEIRASQPFRWPSLLAGLAALAVALMRAILGGRNDLPLLIEGAVRPGMAAVISINWHALNLTFATLAFALFAATRLHRSAAQAIGVIAAIVFGLTCALFMYFTHQVTGSPFTFPPWMALALTALLSAFAAWRA